jgi:hypothetical protein
MDVGKDILGVDGGTHHPLGTRHRHGISVTAKPDLHWQAQVPSGAVLHSEIQLDRHRHPAGVPNVDPRHHAS